MTAPEGSAPETIPVAGGTSWPPMMYIAKATATVLGVIALALLISEVRSVMASIFLGFFFAAGLEPMIRRMEARGLRRGEAVLILVIGVLTAITLIIWLMVVPAVEQASEFVANIPSLLDDLNERGEGREILGVKLDDPEVQRKIQEQVDKIPEILAASLGTVYGILGGIVTALFGIFSVFALTIYFMMAMPRLHSFAARALRDPEKVEVLDSSLDRIGGYVTGQLVVSLTAGIFAGVVLSVLGVPYSMVLGLAVAFFSAIPQVGATIGAVVCTLVALTESWHLALAVFVILVAYQQFENYFLAPRVFSKAVDLSPIAVFIAVLVGAAVGGAIGALTALPVTAALKVIFRYVFREQLGRIDSEAYLGRGVYGDDQREDIP
ncbi:AI-2E family transporter [Sporichthya polymorpha]|uniref:AI-2E family transporter n=1 Tax=Sporichthya polymorpha TaxID=35751 RepID=UPI00036227E8|nr:AI-2E family transporter [Sporichthya polymorpha]